MDPEEDGELRNPFPSPPSHYHKYTTHNVNLLALLQERSKDLSEANQAQVLHDQTDLPDWSLSQLEKPRIDWILEEEDPHFSVFGDTWFVKEKDVSLAEHGVQQLYASDPSIDRRPTLVSILRSLLLTYHNMTSSLLNPPPIHTEEPPEWRKNIEWLRILGQNLMAAANELRPIQARGNLELMMKRQLEHRRQETAELHRRCDEWETNLAALRTRAGELPHTKIATQTRAKDHEADTFSETTQGNNESDVLRWAEEIEV